MRDAIGLPGALSDYVTGFVRRTGIKVELQVSKVKAYANGIARRGDDQGAAVVNSAITTTQSYKGVKFERKGPT